MAVAALAAGGLLFAWSGLVNVAASSGHWAVTDWFLHWVMRNSVKTHAMGTAVPDLSNPALLHRGAGHYQSGCAWCHGAPGEPQNPAMLAATPPPPELLAVNEKWQPHQLFWIVKHGIKFTAMPAWIALDRDDEIWSMVAFLRALPAMSAERYRALAFGDVATAPVRGDRADVLLADCARCHGRDGAGRDNDAFPLIGGQNEAYLADALRAYAAGWRHSGTMQLAAARVRHSDLARIVRHYASQPPAASKEPLNPALVTAGERIAREGLAGQGVPACLTCHDSQARQRNPRFPRLDGQHASYLAGQLDVWQKNARGGGPYAHLMGTIARRLTPGQIEAAAAFFASRPAQEVSPQRQSSRVRVVE
jgi:cytochrome c553